MNKTTNRIRIIKNTHKNIKIRTDTKGDGHLDRIYNKTRGILMDSCRGNVQIWFGVAFTGNL